MRDLARADFKTIKTFISNNVTAERLLVDIIQASSLENFHQSSKLTSSTHHLDTPASKMIPSKLLLKTTKSSDMPSIVNQQSEISIKESNITTTTTTTCSSTPEQVT